ncbi:DUF397 domain-containing protein [Nocardia carnea]|uniref:DUF397 domain-containing protein n=1 Tax=Nocardia carnea TaxID=37328 RepID=UPI0024549EFC|nr:DUF397 domain-containing protein [Nocardia carnea]
MLKWRKSSFTNPETCVEVAKTPTGTFLVRNSNARNSGTAEFTELEWSAFIRGVKNDEFDPEIM